jgi:phosphoglycolate phosphatase
VAVLLDWDNTLVENWLAIQAAFNAARAAFAMEPLDLDQIKVQARHSSREVFPLVFGEGWQEARDIFYAHFAAHQLGGLRVMPGAGALLDLFADYRLPLGVVSNKRGDMLRREIAHLGWSERFLAVIGAQDAPADKPDPAPVHLAVSRMGIAAAAGVWLVGDTDIDMRAAVAAGCVPIFVAPRPEDQTFLPTVEPALRCHNCMELIDFIRQHWAPISPHVHRNDGREIERHPNNSQREESVNER